MNLTLTGFATFAFFVNSYFIQPHIKSPNFGMKTVGSSLAFGLLFCILHSILIREGFMEEFGVGAAPALDAPSLRSDINWLSGKLKTHKQKDHAPWMRVDRKEFDDLSNRVNRLNSRDKANGWV